MDDGEFTLEGRVLCPDGACIGVVGPDRRCKVCGALYEGEESPTEAPAAGSEDDPLARPLGGGDPPDALDNPDRKADPDERICCPDGSCVGIIGPDGLCGTCGKPG